MHTAPQNGKNSDTKYIFILFGLIFIVLFFAFLIYFVYGQKQFSSLIPADNPAFEKTLTALEEKVVNEAVKGTTTSSTSTVATTVPVTTTTTLPTPTKFDPSRYNPRDTSTTNLRGRELLDKYFASIKSADYQTACSLLSNTICNARRDIYSFSQFLNKTA